MGDRLIGAAIVGTGLPQVNTEREVLKSIMTGWEKMVLIMRTVFPA